MAPKIKSLILKPKDKRTCMICGRERDMERHQRFCSRTCKSTATEISKFGSEFRVNVGKK